MRHTDRRRTRVCHRDSPAPILSIVRCSAGKPSVAFIFGKNCSRRTLAGPYEPYERQDVCVQDSDAGGAVARIASIFRHPALRLICGSSHRLTANFCGLDISRQQSSCRAGHGVVVELQIWLGRLEIDAVHTPFPLPHPQRQQRFHLVLIDVPCPVRVGTRIHDLLAFDRRAMYSTSRDVPGSEAVLFHGPIWAVTRSIRCPSVFSHRIDSDGTSVAVPITLLRPWPASHGPWPDASCEIGPVIGRG